MSYLTENEKLPKTGILSYGKVRMPYFVKEGSYWSVGKSPAYEENNFCHGINANNEADVKKLLNAVKPEHRIDVREVFGGYNCPRNDCNGAWVLVNLVETTRRGEVCSKVVVYLSPYGHIYQYDPSVRQTTDAGVRKVWKALQAEKTGSKKAA